MLTRRLALFSAASGFALAACTTASATTPAQIVADAQGMIAVLQVDFPVIMTLDPSLTTPANQAKITADLTAAQAEAAKISASVPALTGATTLQTVENTINEVLDVLSPVVTAVTGSPLAPYSLVVQALIALLPSIETYVNTTLGVAGSIATIRAKAVAPTMAPGVARKVLGIQTL